MFKLNRNIGKAALLVLGLALPPALAQADNLAPSAESIGLFFVQTADQFQLDADAKTFRLVNINPETVYFSDRPARLAGHVDITEYLKNWRGVPGGFDTNPPNATLSVQVAGEAQPVLAVVTILEPRVDGNDLVYGYELIKGSIPGSGGQATLFIDRIGVGGGVGAGYHGVGVGARGPGVAGWAGVAARTSVDATTAVVVGTTAVVAADAATTSCVTSYNAYGQKITTCN